MSIKKQDTATLDSKAVITLRALLDPALVDTKNIKEQDTTPNHDGYIEIKDGNSKQLGQFHIQVKYANTQTFNSRKYNKVEKSFLEWVKDSSTSPVLFFIVSADAKKAYWKQITVSCRDRLLPKPNQKTATISFPKSQLIQENEKSYYQEWLEILKNHKKIIKDGDELEQEKRHYRILREIGEDIKDPDGLDYSKIQEFLDELNNLLNGSFKIIKKILMPNIWEMGFAFSQYDQGLLGTIFPIQKGHVNLKIKKVSQNTLKNIKGLTIEGYASNPIELNPIAYAHSHIKTDLNKIFSARALEFTHPILIAEAIFAIIDNTKELHVALGITTLKDEYSIEELNFGCNTYLSLWIEEALKAIHKATPNYSDIINYHRYGIENKRFFLGNLRALIQMANPLIKTIKATVASKIEKCKKAKQEVYICDFQFQQLLSRLNTLKATKVAKINRPYPMTFSKQQLKEVYEQLPEAYENILKINFPDIQEKLNIFKQFQLIVILKNPRASFLGFCQVEIFYVKRGKPEKSILVYLDNEITYKSHHQTLIIDDQSYTYEKSSDYHHTEVEKKLIFVLAIEEIQENLKSLYSWLR